jgi:pimeloyl-ACP methyl ester carboxylesterase
VNNATGRYASVNGLELYHEIHGTGPPLVLLHGAMATFETSFGGLLPSLAKTRQVIAVEQQAHGHTADVDRPLRYEQLADDTAALLRHLGIGRADFFGWSMGAGIALQLAIRYPELTRKLIAASVTYNQNGFYPEFLAGTETADVIDLTGSPWHEAYLRTAPNPSDWSRLVAKVFELDRETQDWSPEAIRAIKAPALLIVGDSDIVRPEHAVELFRLFGGGVPGDIVGRPASRLAVLPGTTHQTLVQRADWLLSMIDEFLDEPMPA